MAAREWTNQAVYDLLCKIDRGYQPDETEQTMLETREVLKLWNKKLIFVPKSIRMLRSLRELDLHDNQISELPDTIGDLARLTVLDLSCTQIKSLPGQIGQLKSLQWLELRYTPFTALPDSIGQLKRLQWLSLYGTKIKTLPECIRTLTELEYLLLGDSGIEELPDWIGELPKLKYLDLSALTIPEIPRSLALRGLPFIEQGIIHFDDYGVNLRETVLTEQKRRIFLDTPELIPSLYQDQIRVPECRVLFLGDGDSGKTYTIRRIRNGGKKETAGQPYPTKETPGVEIADWHAARGADSFDIHFWDFGGQELLHSMHRCFLTDQSCYVVTVKSRETKGTQRARYWLRNVTAFAPNSPILLFVNCWDDDDGRRSIDEPRLKKDFPNIKAVVYVSAKEASDEDFVKELMEPLIGMAADSEACRRTVNSRWLAVRNAIARESGDGKGKKRHYLTKDRYHALCQEAGVEDDNAPALLSYFNTLGVCFSYHRDADNNELADYKLLNPVWLTNAVYAVIEEGMVFAQRGTIKLDAIRTLLGNRATDELILKDETGKETVKVPRRRTMPEYVYTGKECRWVVDVAAAHNLCYEVDRDTLFFPALCTNNTPEEALGEQEGFSGCAEYRFRYDYLPDSVLHRLMIRCLKKGLALRSCWLRGMILDVLDTHRAIVRMDEDETLKVEIWYKEGKAAFELFPMLRAEILAVGEGLNLKAKEQIAEGRDSFPLVQLVRACKSRNDACWGNETGDEFSVKELLGRFFDTETLDRLDVDKDGRLVIGPYPYHRRDKSAPALRRALWEAYGKKCQYCNLPLGYDELQIDHILATKHLKSRDNRTELYLAELAQRGFDLKKPDYVENYFPSCGKCNRGKSNATREAVTLREYHAVAREHLDEVLALTKQYDISLRKEPDLSEPQE